MEAAVIISSKKDNFVAGADIEMLAAAKNHSEAQTLSEGGQKVMNAIQNARFPVVAAINGSCLGGGLELALACRYRIATESSKTVLGLPEVKLGLLPGAGGTQRLPRLVGLQAALDMMLTGKNIQPKRAKRMGLVDQLVDPNALETAAIQAAKELANGSRKINREKNITRRVMEDTPVRKLVFKKAEEMVQKNTGGKYPAPFAILRSVETGINSGVDRGSKVEAEEFGRLALTQESAALISLFFAQTSLKKNRFGNPSRSYENIAMLGAGLMGAGIAEVSIARNMNVKLVDRDQPSLARGEKQIYDGLNSKVKRRHITSFDMARTLARLNTFTSDDAGLKEHLKNVDMLIEAVPEDLKLKHKVLQAMEELVPDHCIIATNTSALRIADVASGLSRPENVIGMHYFSPVPKMPLLEVITYEGSSKEARAAAVHVGIQQGKTVIVVKDGPGFYTTRILMPYMLEAVNLLQEGAPIMTVDKALKSFGFPVGPVTLMDEVGIDVGTHIAKYLGGIFGERMGGNISQDVMDKMTEQGYLGRKSGKGFFIYDKKPQQSFLTSLLGKKSKREINQGAAKLFPSKENAVPLEEIQQRTFLRFVNEAVMCLEEGILETPTDGDVGAVFGLGFPPFYGGPFRYIDRFGADKVVSDMKGLADRYGQRFAPAELLLEHAKSGKKFHPTK